MTSAPEPRYATPRAFRAALENEIRRASRASGLPLATLRRDFAHSIVLARLFSSDAGNQWVLKGGTGLLMRIEGARHSRDLDLARLNPTDDLDEAFHELRSAVSGYSDRDRFSLDISRSGHAVAGDGGGLELRVTANLDGRVFDQFPIDMVGHQDLVGHIDVRPIRFPLTIPDVAPAPHLNLYPLEDQVADKILALYDRYGTQRRPSSRFRDLADLLVIVTDDRRDRVDPSLLTLAVRRGARARGTALPRRFVSPGDAWTAGYAAAAASTPLPQHLQSLDAALEEAQRHLGYALVGD